MVYKLECSLYGLAQSSVLWDDTINAEMLTVGFAPTQSDPCDLFERKRRHLRGHDSTLSTPF